MRIDDDRLGQGVGGTAELAEYQTAATATALAGPTKAERATGITSALLGSRVVSAVRVSEGRAVVELTTLVEGAGRNDEVLAFAQLVCTLTAHPDISGVTFTRDQRPIGVPRADGSLSQGPLTADDYAHLIAGK